MRLMYVDEAGRASRQQEPYFIVTGVIIEPDKQWRRLEEYYREMISDLFPGYDPYRFVFHAHEILGGRGAFDKERWPLKERRKVLRRLAQVPRLFGLRLAIGAVRRDEIRTDLLQRNPKAKEKDVILHCHVRAFLEAIQQAEYWMRRNAPEECAMVIAEDTDKVKAILKDFHEGYTDQTLDEDLVFRSNHFIDTLTFAKKHEAALLQIADHCAFIVKRTIMEVPDVYEFYNAIEPQIIREDISDKPFHLRIPLSHLIPVSDLK